MIKKSKPYCYRSLTIWSNDQWNGVGRLNGHGFFWGYGDPLRKERGALHARVYMEGFLMPRLGDLVQSFPHLSMVDEEAAAPLDSVFVGVLFHFVL